jgi:hypothetical protein
MSNIFSEEKVDNTPSDQIQTIEASGSEEFNTEQFLSEDFNGVSDIVSALGKFSGSSFITTLGAQVSSMFNSKFNDVLTDLQFPDSVYDLVKKELPTLTGQLKSKIIEVTSSFNSPLDLLTKVDQFDQLLSTDNIKDIILNFVKEKTGSSSTIDIVADLVGGAND